MRTYAIDFETYYDDECSVTELGIWNYVRHPRFDAYLVSIVGDDGTRYSDIPEKAPWHLLDGQRVIAHNASFEIAICTVNRYPFTADEWYDTIDLARFLGLSQRVNLKDLAQVALGRTLSKDPRTRAKGMTRADFMADAEAWKEIREYCYEDSDVTLAIWQKYEKHWPESERRLAWQTRQIQLRGVPVDLDLIRQSRVTLNAKRDECLESMPWYPAKPPMSIPAFRETCERFNMYPPLPSCTGKNDPEFVDFVKAHRDTYPWVTAMGELRSANRTEKLLQKMENFTTREISRTHIGLKYFGAHTGRWSGDEVNLQNQTKKPVFGVDTRATIQAGEGNVFVIYDYAQIEPRVLAWIAGDTEFLDLVRGGMSVYEAHARIAMGWTGGVLKEENPGIYAFAKARVLGLGYGMGKDRFYEECQSNPDFQKNNIHVSFEEAERTVNEYRTGNWRIPKLWKDLETQVRRMVGQTVGSLVLPSGRPQRYYHIKSRKVYDEKYDRERDQLYVSHYLNDRKGHPVWGGEVTENVVQAVARDILGEACLRIEDYYDIIPTFTVHDEAVYEVPENEADVWAERIRSGMVELPSWATGLPLEVEGMITKVYTK